MQTLHSPTDAAAWLRSRVSGTIHTDSRRLRPGDGFIAWPGAATDARQHVAAALAGGAAACLVERTGVEAYALDAPAIAAYADLKAASGPIAAAFFGEPSRQLALCAVTGTNGKTSTAWWLAQALSNLKQVSPLACAMVGTLGVGRVPAPGSASATATADIVATGLTTPDPVLLQRSLRRFVDEGLQACAIEASSIGLAEHRLDGCQIRCAIFTNFTQDHLDYHGTMAAYWQAKTRLFQWPGLQSAVINVDDPRGAELAASVGDQLPEVWTVSCTVPARLRAHAIRYDAQGLRFSVIEQLAPNAAGAEVGLELSTRLIGTYNVTNLLGVIGAMRALGVPLAAAVAACGELSPVPGRMQCEGGVGQPLVAVDYAHTPDALAKALQALRSLADQRGGRLWCLFGCGGDRDTAKRPVMGAMAARYAEQVLITSDNPRSERPEAIISQILLGLSGHAATTVEVDRARAIAQALALAQPADVVLVAGKGHEEYQEIAGQRLPFSDLAQVRQQLAARPLAPTRAQEEPDV